MEVEILARNIFIPILIVMLFPLSDGNDFSFESSKLLECNGGNGRKNMFCGDDTYLNEISTNWFCKYQDEVNEKGIRKRIETWLNIVSDNDEALSSSNFEGLVPFQSYEMPHIDIHIGYLANRKRIKEMKYEIFKSNKLLNAGVMMNGNIYANVSTDHVNDWNGILTIMIGSEIRTNNGKLMNTVKFRIKTQLHKSKLHGIVRVWGKFPSDYNDACKSRIENGLGLICHYANGLPKGKCWKGLLGGAWIYGEVATDGEFSGNDVAYINQDMSVGYKGVFHRGLMINASVVSITGERCNADGIKVLQFTKSLSYSGITFRYKRPNSDSMGDKPFVNDPLDNKYIDIGQSSIDTGELSQEFKENGAFAKEDIPPHTVISHNNGYIVNEKEKHQWIQNQMEILKTTKKSDADLEVKFEENFKKSAQKYSTALRCSEFLQIPGDIGQMKNKYRSTWGHKINHCFTRQNSQSIYYDSAQFGVIVAIKTLNKVNILKGQEIFLHYGYSYSASPKWYKDSFIKFVRQQKDAENIKNPHWQHIRKKVFSEANITTASDASNAVLDKLLQLYRDFSENNTKYE